MTPVRIVLIFIVVTNSITLLATGFVLYQTQQQIRSIIAVLKAMQKKSEPRLNYD